MLYLKKTVELRSLIEQKPDKDTIIEINAPNRYSVPEDYRLIPLEKLLRIRNFLRPLFNNNEEYYRAVGFHAFATPEYNFFKLTEIELVQVQIFFKKYEDAFYSKDFQQCENILNKLDRILFSKTRSKSRMEERKEGQKSVALSVPPKSPPAPPKSVPVTKEPAAEPPGNLIRYIQNFVRSSVEKPKTR